MLLTARKKIFLIALLILSVFNANTVCAEISIPVYVYPDIRAQEGNLKFLDFSSNSGLLEFEYVNDQNYKHDQNHKRDGATVPRFFVKSNNSYFRAFSAFRGYFSTSQILPQKLFLGMLTLKKILTSTEAMEQMSNIENDSYYFQDMLSGNKRVLSAKYDIKNIQTASLENRICEINLDLCKIEDKTGLRSSDDNETCFIEMDLTEPRL